MDSSVLCAMGVQVSKAGCKSYRSMWAREIQICSVLSGETIVVAIGTRRVKKEVHTIDEAIPAAAGAMLCNCLPGMPFI